MNNRGQCPICLHKRALNRSRGSVVNSGSYCKRRRKEVEFENCRIPFDPAVYGGERRMNDPAPIPPSGMSEADKQLITVLLAQFNACRAEIQARSSNQAAVVNLNITAIGIIGGYYFVYHANPIVLLIIPLLSPMLGIIWADHAINIGNLGRFIQRRLMPTLSETLNHELPDYEVWIRTFEQQKGRRLLLLIAPMLLIFAILPTAALILACAVALARDRLFWALVGTGAALILIFGSYSTSILFGWIWSDDLNPAENSTGSAR